MENSKIKNILVIDNHDSFVYNLVQILRENGTNAVLIGETLMRSPDKCRELDILRGKL